MAPHSGTDTSQTAGCPSVGTGCRLIAPHTPYPCDIPELRTECSKQASMTVMHARSMRHAIDLVRRHAVGCEGEAKQMSHEFMTPAPHYLQRLFGAADGTDGGEGGSLHGPALTRCMIHASWHPPPLPNKRRHPISALWDSSSSIALNSSGAPLSSVQPYSSHMRLHLDGRAVICTNRWDQTEDYWHPGSWMLLHV